jgi:hypothetical protein
LSFFFSGIDPSLYLSNMGGTPFNGGEFTYFTGYLFGKLGYNVVGAPFAFGLSYLYPAVNAFYIGYKNANPNGHLLTIVTNSWDDERKIRQVSE